MILDAMEVMCTVYTTVPEIYLSQLHGQKTIQPKVMGGMRLLIGCCPARSGRPGTLRRDVHLAPAFPAILGEGADGPLISGVSGRLPSRYRKHGRCEAIYVGLVLVWGYMGPMLMLSGLWSGPALCLLQ